MAATKRGGMPATLLKACILSRLFFLTLQCVTNYILNDYDSSGEISLPAPRTLFNSSALYQTDHTISIAHVLFGGFHKWDSVYFDHIIVNGYKYEQMFAFFPGLPVAIRTIVGIIALFVPNIQNSQLLVFFVIAIINCTCFVVNTSYLYRLSLIVTKDEDVASLSCFIFMVNPATVFFMGSYSEAMYSCLQFSMMYLFEERKYVTGSIVAGLSVLVRSNGILSLAFLLYFVMRDLVKSHIFLDLSKNQAQMQKRRDLFGFIGTVLEYIFCCCIIVIPFASYLSYTHFTVCDTYIGKESSSHWCSWKFPLSYSYIQSHYWNVGFLRYYTLNQIPNFLLAAPICCIIVMAVVTYFRKTYILQIVSLGMVDTDRHTKAFDSYEMSDYPAAFVYICHATLLMLFGLFTVHVQILTRMLCSSTPVVYWFIATTVLKCRRTKKPWSWILILYCCVYNVLGFTLHCNFYPWT